MSSYWDTAKRAARNLPGVRGLFAEHAVAPASRKPKTGSFDDAGVNYARQPLQALNPLEFADAKRMLRAVSQEPKKESKKRRRQSIFARDSSDDSESDSSSDSESESDEDSYFRPPRKSSSPKRKGSPKSKKRRGTLSPYNRFVQKTFERFQGSGKTGPQIFKIAGKEWRQENGTKKRKSPGKSPKRCPRGKSPVKAHRVKRFCRASPR